MGYRWFGVVVFAATLASCGGGGGGGGAGNGGAPSGGSTGLVPAAEAPGAELAADATALRPLRAGARWEYRGTAPIESGGSRAYQAIVQQEGGTGGWIVERSNNVLESGSTDEEGLAFSGGSILARVIDPLDLGTTDTVTMTELRSPVRAGDQYTQLEASNVALGVDVDGDGVQDRGDVAIYSKVAGSEALALPEAGRTVTAIRLDTTFAVRVTRSRDNSALPAVLVVESRWYASGIGIVRRSLAEGSTVVADEVLVHFDGGDAGVGARTASPVQGADIRPGSQPLRGVLALAVAGETAWLLSDADTFSTLAGPRISTLDRRGNVQQSRAWTLPANSRQTAAIHGVGAAQAVMTFRVPGGVPLTEDLQLQVLDSTGAAQSGPVPLLLAANGALATGYDGNALWVLWRRRDVTLSNEIMLQPFALDGSALAAAERVAGPSMGLDDLRLAAAGGRVLATWTDSVGGTPTYRYALRDGVGGTAAVHTFGTASGAGFFASRLLPLLGSDVAALFWQGTLLTPSATAFEAEQNARPRAVVLDAAGLPVRSAGGSIDNELMPLAWTDDAAQRATAQALGDSIVFATWRTSLQLPGASQASDYVLATRVRPGAAALATAAAAAMPVYSRSGTLSDVDRFGTLRLLGAWSDSALAVGENGQTAMKSPFWLPPP